jgi:hypothetical protein
MPSDERLYAFTAQEMRDLYAAVQNQVGEFDFQDDPKYPENQREDARRFRRLQAKLAGMVGRERRRSHA